MIPVFYFIIIKHSWRIKLGHIIMNKIKSLLIKYLCNYHYLLRLNNLAHVQNVNPKKQLLIFYSPYRSYVAPFLVHIGYTTHFQSECSLCARCQIFRTLVYKRLNNNPSISILYDLIMYLYSLFSLFSALWAKCMTK